MHPRPRRLAFHFRRLLRPQRRQMILAAERQVHPVVVRLGHPLQHRRERRPHRRVLRELPLALRLGFHALGQFFQRLGVHPRHPFLRHVDRLLVLRLFVPPYPVLKLPDLLAQLVHLPRLLPLHLHQLLLELQRRDRRPYPLARERRFLLVLLVVRQRFRRRLQALPRRQLPRRPPALIGLAYREVRPSRDHQRQH